MPSPAGKPYLSILSGPQLVGRDPRKMTRDELIQSGVRPCTPLGAIRDFCYECTGGRRGAINDCTDVKCRFWVFRMNGDPWKRK